MHQLTQAKSRRQFIRVVGSGLLLALAPQALLATNSAQNYWIGTAKSDGRYWLIILNKSGDILRRIELRDRGHGIAQHTNGRIIVCARRPGQWMLVLDHVSSQPKWLWSGHNRRFTGHCCCSADGAHLYSAENDFARGIGVIGVWDVTTNKRTHEWPSQGIGPHEINLSNDAQSLWIANGGIQTHPDRGRDKLNIDTMMPNVCSINAHNGELNEIYQINESQLSLRHLAVNSDHQVAVAGQYEGPEHLRKNLMLLINKGNIDYLPCDTKNTVALHNYLGSVAFDTTGKWIAASSPRGNLVLIWNVIDMKLHRSLSLIDPCGVSATEQAGEFFITTGQGSIWSYMSYSDSFTSVQHSPQIAWDNHLYQQST